MVLQVRQFQELTADDQVLPPDPEQADFRWDTQEIRDFHRALEVRVSHCSVHGGDHHLPQAKMQACMLLFLSVPIRVSVSLCPLSASSMTMHVVCLAMQTP